MPDVDWELSYDGVSLSFGTLESGYLFPRKPTVGVRSFVDGDMTVPDGDGVMFGVDELEGQTVTVEVNVIRTDDEAAARSLLSAFSRAWRGDSIRRDPGAVAVLRSESGRVAFGRPRRFDFDDALIHRGYVNIEADFAASSDLWFGDEESSSVTLVPPPGGGVVAPVVAPVTTSLSSDRSSSFTVGGVVDTWPVFEVFGPVSRPAVEVVGLFRLEYGGSLAYDEVLTIDTNPHARTVTVNGAGVALSPSSARLASCSVPPGVHVLSLFGTSVSGTASASVMWRNAFTNF